MRAISDKYKKRIALILVVLSATILASDFVYKTVNDITYSTRQKCILYLKLPKAGFIFYEQFVELFMIVVIGIFFAVLLESYFNRYKKFYPKNPFTAFLYASLIPVCACTTLPLVKSLKDKIGFTTLITFIISAPLLSPYIIVLSFTVLGVKYGILRIVASFILAFSTGLILNFFNKRMKTSFDLSTLPAQKNKQACPIGKNDLLTQTYNIIISVLPFIGVAAAFGILTELYMPVDFLKEYNFDKGMIGLVLLVLVGIPIYYCHGADVVFLKPLIRHSGLQLGSAMAFSLTSTAVCITSAVLMLKFMGRRMTIILFSCVFIISILLGLLINWLA
ncbi:MAG: permease [Bacteroidales bacterium]|nr:permease [Bacteroidales bacterium]